MRFLILGKNGMLGRDILDAFHQEDVVALQRDELDICNREDVFEQFMTIQPDVVINATGYTNVDKAETEPELANDINGYAVGILAQACREIDATLVHFSSDYVFSGKQKKGYNEDDLPEPLSAYGRSKALGEHLLMEEMESMNDKQQSEGKYFLIRTSWLFGKNGPNFVDTMLEQCKKSAKLKVVNDQFGKPTYTVDLAKQVLWLLKTHDYPYGIYHITNDGVTSWYQYALEIFRQAGYKVNVVPCKTDDYKRAAPRPVFSALNNNLLPALRPWQEALEEYLTKEKFLNP
ncbi:MAG TPA: dTDP-4-dehydrorhamnose reductase [Candidatus Gracilibacteria bacterium]|nr:dTDP-4-dehydrorhamnose reductase [Candidatus Gracilibacteria bacterium]HRY91086.1 dTDP-4-dehydrorhamnose reductase [Candidatus Gracilibacteria bacterium]